MSSPAPPPARHHRGRRRPRHYATVPSPPQNTAVTRRCYDDDVSCSRAALRRSRIVRVVSSPFPRRRARRRHVSRPRSKGQAAAPTVVATSPPPPPPITTTAPQSSAHGNRASRRRRRRGAPHTTMNNGTSLRVPPGVRRRTPGDPFVRVPARATIRVVAYPRALGLLPEKVNGRITSLPGRNSPRTPSGRDRSKRSYARLTRARVRSLVILPFSSVLGSKMLTLIAMILVATAVPSAVAWDSDQMEVFDLVEEMNNINFYQFLDVPEVSRPT